MKTDHADATNDCFILIYYALREKNDKKTSCFNNLFIRRYLKGCLFPIKGI